MEKEVATHSSILPWKRARTEKPGGLQSMGFHDWALTHGKGGGRRVGSNKTGKTKKKKKKRNRHTMWAKESRPHCRAEREGKASPGQRLLTLCEHQNYPENLLNIQGSDQQRRHVIQKTSLTNASRTWSRGLPGGPVAGALCFHCRGAWVQALVRDLRFHMQFGQ